VDVVVGVEVGVAVGTTHGSWYWNEVVPTHPVTRFVTRITKAGPAFWSVPGGLVPVHSGFVNTDCAGAVTVIWVSDVALTTAWTLTPSAAFSKRTLASSGLLGRFRPLIVTTVPGGPKFGSTWVIVGWAPM
jgi:hypothetical protein